MRHFPAVFDSTIRLTGLRSRSSHSNPKPTGPTARARERRFDPRTLEIACRLFIDNDPPKKLSSEYGVIHQRINAIRRTVQKAVADYGLPEGWSEVTLAGPADLVRVAKAQFERQKRARLGSAQ